MNVRPLATLVIEDSENPGCVNIHYRLEPCLVEESPAHNLMARVLEHLKDLVGQELKGNLCASNQSSPPSGTPAG